MEELQARRTRYVSSLLTAQIKGRTSDEHDVESSATMVSTGEKVRPINLFADTKVRKAIGMTSGFVNAYTCCESHATVPHRGKHTQAMRDRPVRR